MNLLKLRIQNQYTEITCIPIHYKRKSRGIKISILFTIIKYLEINSPKGFPGGSEVKRLPAKQETWVRSLDQEDPLEKEMATHSSTLAWKIPWTEKPSRLQSMGSQKVGRNWATSQGDKRAVYRKLYTLMKEIKEDINKWKVYHVLGSEEWILWKWLYYSFTICTETLKTPNSQINLEKWKWRWKNQASWFQAILQNYSNQDSMVLA